METDKDFPSWYENYSEGLPLFAEKWQDKLEGLANHPSMMREPVCLAVAFTLGHQYLMHDIAQTMIDSMDGATSPRDEVIRISAETIEAVTLGTFEISENPWDSQIQYATKCALNPGYIEDDVPEAGTIRELVALVRVIGALM